VRNRLLSDPRFLFKVGAEVAIDAGQDYLSCMAMLGVHSFLQLMSTNKTGHMCLLHAVLLFPLYSIALHDQHQTL